MLFDTGNDMYRTRVKIIAIFLALPLPAFADEPTPPLFYNLNVAARESYAAARTLA
jgi:hypothetical protein